MNDNVSRGVIIRVRNGTQPPPPFVIRAEPLKVAPVRPDMSIELHEFRRAEAIAAEQRALQAIRQPRRRRRSRRVGE
jgi:hypothetical protein